MDKKGQSALEYLMTYGWALVVIVIVVAALFAFGIFSPPTPSACIGFSSFAYVDHAIDPTTTDLRVILVNGSGSTATITAVVSSGDFAAGGAGSLVNGIAVPSPVSSGAEFTILEVGSGAGISGTYSGTLTITYTSASGLSHTESASCSGSV